MTQFSDIKKLKQIMTENYKEDGEAAFKDPPDEEDTSYYMNEIGEQILKYPKITIKIRLSVR